jgi:hypothetical protein
MADSEGVEMEREETVRVERRWEVVRHRYNRHYRAIAVAICSRVRMCSSFVVLKSFRRFVFSFRSAFIRFISSLLSSLIVCPSTEQASSR